MCKLYSAWHMIINGSNSGNCDSGDASLSVGGKFDEIILRFPSI